MYGCLVAQLCSSLCDSLKRSPSGSFVCGIFQARILEWLAISFPPPKKKSYIRDLKTSRSNDKFSTLRSHNQLTLQLLKKIWAEYLGHKIDRMPLNKRTRMEKFQQCFWGKMIEVG